MDTSASVIQKSWKNYKNKKDFESDLFKKQMEIFNTYIEMIKSLNYNILFVKYLLNSVVNDISIVYKKDDCYHMYNDDLFICCNKKELDKQLNFLNNNRILSMSIQCIVTDLNFYKYPEIFEIKVY